MNRRHAAVIALLLGLAAALGVLAAGRTVHLGAATRSASQAQIAARERRLAAGERALRQALAKAKSTVAASAAPAAPAATAPRTVYVRPAPIVVHRHAGGESESGAEGGSDD